MMSPRVVVRSWLLLAVPCAWLYAPVITKLVHDWSHDENYSHGFLIVPLAAWFAWRQRERLLAARAQHFALVRSMSHTRSFTNSPARAAECS